MSVQVDPIILSKLEEFRKRRRNLIILRGLCSAVVSLLAVFTVIAVSADGKDYTATVTDAKQKGVSLSPTIR